MGRYDFVSPGAMAGQGLLETLTKNRLENRQRMLDELQQQNIQSEISNRQSQAASAAEERSAMAEWRKSQAADNADKKAQRERSRTGFHNFVTQHPEIDGKTKQMLDLADQTGDDDLYKTIVSRVMTPDKSSSDEWMPVYDYNGHPTGDWAPKGAHFTQRPPAEPRTPREPSSVAGRDEHGHGVILQDGNLWVTEPGGKREPYTGPLDAKASATGSKTAYTPQEMAKAADLRAKATPTPGRVYGTNQPDPKNVAAWEQFREGVINRHQASPDVNDTIRDILNTEGPEVTNDEILAKDLSNFDNPKDQNDFKDLLYFLRGGQ